jgi:ANTAR domain-containing protein
MSYRADDTSRQVIDIATGILVGLRGCSRREAFDELVRVMHQTGIGIGGVAAGLVALATDDWSADEAETFGAWRDLLRRSRLVSVAAAS